jgi:hypothetical protein
METELDRWGKGARAHLESGTVSCICVSPYALLAAFIVRCCLRKRFVLQYHEMRERFAVISMHGLEA